MCARDPRKLFQHAKHGQVRGIGLYQIFQNGGFQDNSCLCGFTEGELYKTVQMTHYEGEGRFICEFLGRKVNRCKKL